MKKLFFYAALVAVAAAAGLNYKTAGVMAERVASDDKKTGTSARPENTTPQTLPFTQDWTNVGLITANDDWSGVPGIQGFLGDYNTAGTPTNVDARTVLVDMATLDVIANLTNATATNGGVGEFEITNPVVGLQGSGTADAPNLVIYINATGQSNIRFSCLVRDIDDTADNSVQQVAVQYRVGGTGDFSNVPGSYIADASAGPSLTLDTPIDVTLPPQANNQANLQIRVLTTNAGGSDEWLGIDNISVTANGPVQTRRAHVDFNGDGRSDYVVARNEGGLKVWYGQYAGSATTFARQWGLNDDSPVPADYDGDGKADIAVWRRDTGPNNRSYYYILNSSNGTFRADQFGNGTDDVDITGDYDGDGKADLAVFRENGTASDPCGVFKSVFYYRPSSVPGSDFTPICWGQAGDRAAPGDYDGDGKYDAVVGRDVGGQVVIYIRNSSNGSFNAVYFGLPTDAFVPGDYDGDGRTDIGVARETPGGGGEFYILEADGGGTGAQPYTIGGIDPQTAQLAPGDYDGDGRTDIAVWVPGSPGTYIIRKATGAFEFFPFGQTGDDVVAEEIVNGGD
ncbi:MAG: VCBS repeat-containing protein [Pyrinomonadaceae bacterium]|nr:VCBS repeat-containing protein [Pyrinomonadaceae bacterium]